MSFPRSGSQDRTFASDTGVPLGFTSTVNRLSPSTYAIITMA